MLIKREIYDPIILTTPDDAAVFSVLNPAKKIAEKIIMENYINFYSFKNLEMGEVFFQFENSVDIGNIEGLEQCFIPISFMKQHNGKVDIILNMLRDQYCISIAVDKSSIKFYGKEAKETHVAFIYGADISRKCFLCKDFSGISFVTFEASFDEIEKSLMKYDRWVTHVVDGLVGFRINKKVPPQIEYSKVYSGFHKLSQEFQTDNVGYGLGAIDLYVNEIKTYQPDKFCIMSWHVIGNYLREAVKLMKFRYAVLKETYMKEQGAWLEGDSVIKKITLDTDRLFFKISKMRIKNIIVDRNKADELAVLVNVCKGDFRIVSEFFCKVISDSVPR